MARSEVIDSAHASPPPRCGERWDDPYPPQLLADYVAIWRERRPAESLAAIAIRTQCRSARRLLAFAAAGEAGSLEQLLKAARGEDGARKSLQVERLDPVALADLAQVLALQEILPDDRRDALALFDLALAVFGAERIPSAHQGFHAQLAYHLGRRARAATLLTTYQEVPHIVGSTLELDLANPFLAADAEAEPAWLRRLETVLPGSRLSFSDAGERSPLDRLVGTADRRIDASQRISVIVTCLEPDAGLLSAVRSLINQTWGNLEILVVDDGSPSRYDPVLQQCRSLDERVRLIKLGANVGLFPARNAGLDAASGEFVAFLDSDDWSHPRRLEQQVGPLLRDDSLVATMSYRLTVNDRMIFTDPRRNVISTHIGSLFFRKDLVLERLGYLDPIRKAADAEYVERVEATFGPSAIQRLKERHILYRQSPQSLSHGEVRRYWLHPARAAYRSAHALWHKQIRAGDARPYLPRHPAARPFPVPDLLRAPHSAPRRTTSYDVVLASDWTPFGGPAKSMLAEIGALTDRGLRVGILHMPAYRYMTVREKPLCAPIQELINGGAFDQVLPTEAHEVGLLIVRYPPVLQFAPFPASQLRVRRVLILANQTPTERDGSDLRYVPRACTRTAERLFSRRPLWVPQGPQARAALEVAGLRPPELAGFDIPAIIDSGECLERTGFRSSLPVVGRHSRDDWTKWPGDRDTLLQVYPDSPDVDVRILGGTKSARSLLPGGRLPRNWLSYGYNEVSVKSFLFQLDFWVYFPHRVRNEAFGRAILEALASGCVVILPHIFSPTFGDAALYREPTEVRQTIFQYWTAPELFLEQSRLAQDHVKRRFGPGQYVGRICSLLGDDAITELAPHPSGGGDPNPARARG